MNGLKRKRESAGVREKAKPKISKKMASTNSHKIQKSNKKFSSFRGWREHRDNKRTTTTTNEGVHITNEGARKTGTTTPGNTFGLQFKIIAILVN